VGDDGAVRLRAPPLFTSLHGYQRAWLSADVAGGMTLLVIAVPEQLATSRLAGMPPITGFYAFVAGTVLFALLGSNPQMSVGADSTIAPLFAAGALSCANALMENVTAISNNAIFIPDLRYCAGGPRKSFLPSASVTSRPAIRLLPSFDIQPVTVMVSFSLSAARVQPVRRRVFGG